MSKLVATKIVFSIMATLFSFVSLKLFNIYQPEWYENTFIYISGLMALSIVCSIMEWSVKYTISWFKMFSTLKVDWGMLVLTLYNIGLQTYNCIKAPEHYLAATIAVIGMAVWKIYSVRKRSA